MSIITTRELLQERTRRRTHPIFDIARSENLPPPLPTNIRGHILKLPTHTLPLHLHRLPRNSIPKKPTRVPPPPKHQLRVLLPRLDNRLLHIPMNRRFNRAHKPGPHINPTSPQTQRGRQTLPVRKPARGNERHALEPRPLLLPRRLPPRGKRLPRPTQQDEIRDVTLADMSRALEAVN